MRKGFGVNTHPKPISLARNSPGLSRRRLVITLVVLAGIAVVWLIAHSVLTAGRQDNGDQPIYTVKRGPLTINITESGTIKNRDQVKVKNEVEGRTTILWIIPEGTRVKKDDLLVQLDDSDLRDRKTQQEATVLSAEASFIGARENLAVTESQTKSNIAEAELDLEFAKLDYEKYFEGEYHQEIQKLQNEETLAKEELNRARDKLKWSETLQAEGYITDSELQADKLAVTRNELDLQLTERKLDVFNTYSHPRNIKQLKSDVTQATEALERVKGQARADMVQAEAQFRAKESEYERQKTTLEKTIDQLAKCRITAPVSGMAVYSTTGQGNWRGNAEPLQDGQEVRERQELIYLPTTSSMMAEVKIHESSLKKVKVGMPVRITCDALPGRFLAGRVGKIGLLPDAQMIWLNPDLTVYTTEIYLDGDGSDIQPGMSCSAEVIVAEYDNVIYVPSQCVLRVQGDPTVYLPGPKGPQPRKVELGLDNNRMVRIISGLEPGEQVLLAPPLSASSVVNGPVARSDSQPADQAADAEPADAEKSPAPEQPGPEADLKIDPSQFAQMSPEQIKKQLESLTPEQRDQLEKMRAGGQTRQGQGGSRRGPAQ